MRITVEQFGNIFPHLAATKRAEYLGAALAAMQEFSITTRVRAAAFFAQVGHESNDLTQTHEIWQGRPDEGTPAQHRYDVRADLGNTPERDGDGFLYRGHGWLQTTGKGNTRRVSRALGLGDLFVEHPELLERPEYAARSAAYFWADNKLNRTADGLTGRGDYSDLVQFDKITKRVNGGYNGRVERERRYLHALSILTDEQFTQANDNPHLDTTSIARMTAAGAVAPLRNTAGAVAVEAPAASPTSAATATAGGGNEASPAQGGAQVVEATENASQGQQTQATATTEATSGATSIIDEIPINDTTKQVGGNIARRLGLKIGGGVATLWGLGAHGRILVVLIAAVVVGVLIYERRHVVEIGRAVLRKFKAGGE